MRELSDCRVLLVDDVKTNIDLLVEALRADYRLSVALNGAAALRVAAESRPDLILLDVRMPGMDGFEVCRQLRADAKTRDTPIMFLSALDEILDKTRAFEVGGTDYVTKPFEILEVKARVRSLLQAKRYRDAVREQIATELLVARDIQMSIVPKDFRPLGAGGPFELHGVLEPARDVGGDLYQFFPVGEGRLCAAVGDVSGKGIPASLFMAITSTLLRTTARQLQKPDLILARVNDELAAENHSDMFVTLVCALLDGVQSTMVLAKGGHPSPVLLRAGEPPRFVFEAPGTALGICLGLEFESVELPLVPGDTVLFYTDGVTEAFDRSGRCFSEAGLMEHLSRSAAVASRDVVEALLHEVRAFSRDVPQSDDIAILAVRFVPGGAAT